MSQAVDLLSGLSDDDVATYTANTEEEHIIVGKDRFIRIPEALKRLGVQHDKDIETVTFDCPRYWDKHDLSQMVIYVNYVLPNGEDGKYRVQNIVAIGDIMHFDWTISAYVTQYNGNISFLICAVTTDEEGNEELHWNSELNQEAYISEGLECTDSPIHNYPDIITHLLTRMEEVEAIATPEAMQGYTDTWLEENAGKSPYDYARDGGYSGTEAEFMRMLNNGLTTTDEIYFQITPEGVISLKPEYRGALPGSDPNYESDNGKGYDGTRNKELPEEIIIPQVVNGIAVTALANNMFCNNKQIKRIVLPSGIEEIPSAFCYGAWNLEEVLNTESVKTLGHNAFNQSGIRKAYFPNLTGFALRTNGNPSTSHFSYCENLVVADLGRVFAESGSAIPEKCFNACEKLVCLRNAEGVTSIGTLGLYATRRLADLPFLSNLSSIGDYGLLLSHADYNWAKLPGCTFGTLSTSKHINTTDYSGCTFTVCNTPMRSTFEQHDPRWVDKSIGNSANTYSAGCVTVSAAMIYSALMGVDMDSPEEFVAAVGAVDESLLNLDVADGVNNTTGGADFWTELVRWLDAVGLKAVVYDSVSPANVQTMYDALASGALVLGRILGDYVETNHVVVFHGVNSNGELRVTDPSAFSRAIGVYEAATYTMPIQNFMRDHGVIDHFIVVTKKATT